MSKDHAHYQGLPVNKRIVIPVERWQVLRKFEEAATISRRDVKHKMLIVSAKNL
jgi:hypothetical protein